MSSLLTLFRWGGGPSYTPLATASADGAAEGQISFAVWRCHRATDVVEVLLSLLHPGVALAVHIGGRTGGPGELRLRVDPLWATGECVSFPLNVDFMDWSCRKKKRKRVYVHISLWVLFFFSIYKACTVKKLKRRNIVKCYQCSIFLHRMMYFNWTFYEQDIFVIKSSVSSKD